MNPPDKQPIATAYEHLKRAAHHAELAAESLCPVEGMAERWERVRELIFTLRKERDALAEFLEAGYSVQ